VKNGRLVLACTKAVLLVMILVSLCGCGKEKDPSQEICGRWVFDSLATEEGEKIDLDDFYGEYIDPSIEDLFDEDCVFWEDGTFDIYEDGDCLTDGADSTYSITSDGIVKVTIEGQSIRMQLDGDVLYVLQEDGSETYRVNFVKQ
jgi:hypothetical protein